MRFLGDLETKNITVRQKNCIPKSFGLEYGFRRYSISCYLGFVKWHIKKRCADIQRTPKTSSFLWRHCAYYSHTLVQESATQESATQQVSALQQVSAATHSVQALSQVVSFAFLLQHELMVRAATATITNNTFFMLFSCFCLTINSNSGAKLHFFLDTLRLNVRYFEKNM